MSQPFRQMTCILIDDEPHALDTLVQLIHKVPIVKPLGAFSSAEAGLAFLHENGPVDIVFSDIDMPEVDGIAAGKLLKQHSQFLVYVTGHREHALDAFGAGADAYLLKPLAYVALVAKMSDFYERVQNTHGNEDADWLFVKGDQRNSLIKLRKKDVVYVQAMGNYIQIHAVSGKHITYMRLNEIATRLAGHLCVQINKSTLVALRQVTQIIGKRVVLATGEEREHPIGKLYQKELSRIVSQYT